MKVTKIVTRAVLYDVENGLHAKMYIGRLSKRAVEKKTAAVCVSLERVKAAVTIPDEIVEKYATFVTIEVIDAPAAEVTEND